MEQRWLYAYTSDVYKTHPGEYRFWAKIGTTDRTPEKRVTEQDNESNPELLDLFWTCKIPNTFTDRDLHRLLETKGYKRCRKDKSREWFSLVGFETGEEKVRLLDATTRELTADPNVGRILFKTHQFMVDAMVAILQTYKSNKSATFGLGACPRFRKTSTMIAWFSLAEVTQSVLVVGAYVQTALTSFATDCSKFFNFVNIECIDTKKDGWQDAFQQTLVLGKKVVLLVSLVKGQHDHFKTNLRVIHDMPSNEKVICIDEADWGAHREQSQSIVSYVRGDSFTVVMTGTNIDRAIAPYKIDEFWECSYIDLLLSRSTLDRNDDMKHLLPFCQMSNDDLFEAFPSVDFYQLFFPQLRDDAFDNDMMPSWQKIVTDPLKASGFIRSFFRMLFYGEGDYEYMTLDNVFKGIPWEKGVMLWLPENTSVKNIELFVNLLCSTLPTWKIIKLDGTMTCGREAEKYITSEINTMKTSEKNKNYEGFIIVSAKMGARSFSISEIDTVLLCYDNGSASQTTQKASRCLTAHTEKHARIVSLSFDQNRYDNVLSPWFIESAIRRCDKNCKTFPDNLRDVLRSINLFTMDDKTGDRIGIKGDDYLKQLLECRRMASVIAIKARTDEILSDDIGNILSRNVLNERSSNKQGVAGIKGKTFSKSKEQQNHSTGRSIDPEKRRRQIIVDNIKFLSEHTEIITAISDQHSMKLAVDTICTNEHMTSEFIEAFRLDPKILKRLIDNDWINVRLLDAVVDSYFVHYSHEQT